MMLPFKLVALDLHLSPTPAASVDHQVSTSIPLLLRFLVQKAEVNGPFQIFFNEKLNQTDF
jgi:hypothetical protein